MLALFLGKRVRGVLRSALDRTVIILFVLFVSNFSFGIVFVLYLVCARFGMPKGAYKRKD